MQEISSTTPRAVTRDTCDHHCILPLKTLSEEYRRGKITEKDDVRGMLNSREE